MPFADKFRAMMEMPFPGEPLGEFTVESIQVGHVGRAPGHYSYPCRLVLAGEGGMAAVRRAIKPLFAQRCTTFSGYGTPYQLWFDKPAMEPLGEGRYAITVEGQGVRVHLAEDLARFLDELAASGTLPAEDVTSEARVELVQGYLERYKAEIARRVGRYRRRIQRCER